MGVGAAAEIKTAQGSRSLKNETGARSPDCSVSHGLVCEF